MNATIQCPLCNDTVDKLVYQYHYESDKVFFNLMKEEHPQWVESSGACSRCYDYYAVQREKEESLKCGSYLYYPVKSVDDFEIIPVPLRLNVNPKFNGSGVTICFIDSGFYLHDDIKHRIKKYVDITDSRSGLKNLKASNEQSWHGTMTAVVGCGDGGSSKGLYKGIASASDLVLLKVQDKNGDITNENIVKALKWVSKNKEKYSIKVLSISLGDNNYHEYQESEIDQLAEVLIRDGVCVIAAAGNNTGARIKPPANAPGVITVGGVDDDNKLASETRLYHSSFDESQNVSKPELVAHAIWIPAPILPGTKEKVEAEWLHRLHIADSAVLIQLLKEGIQFVQIDQELINSNNIYEIRDAIKHRIRETKYFSEDFMHVDGTSFAAPIVSSIVAQMLECNPVLTPFQVREILFSTAARIKDVPVKQQGYGLVNARKAIVAAMNDTIPFAQLLSPQVKYTEGKIAFKLRCQDASVVAVSGSFNNWEEKQYLMEHMRNGIWHVEIPIPSPGEYQYKFLIDEAWVSDFNNPFRVPDGFNDWNSVLRIEEL